LGFWSIILDAKSTNDAEVRELAGRPDLLDLDVAHADITNAACADFKKLPRLRSLNLNGTNVDDVGLKELAESPSLSHLALPIGCTGAGLASLQNLRKLHYLHLVGTALGDEAVEPLARLKQLKVLSGVNGKLSDAGARQLQQALPNTLVVHTGALRSEAEQQALRWALQKGAKATCLFADGAGKDVIEVPRTEFGVTQLIFPAQADLSGAEKLRGLRCVDYVIWPQNGDAAAEHLAALTSLTAFNCGELSEVALEKLTTLEQLERLWLGDCPSGDDGYRHLAAFGHLWSLYLGGSSIGDRGLVHLGEIPRLKELSLNGCPNITSSGLAPLAKLRMLRHLHLDRTPIDDATVPHLAKLESLRILHLSGTKLTATGVSELGQALPKCVIFWDGGAVFPGAAP
jgi:hypothetical protein